MGRNVIKLNESELRKQISEMIMEILSEWRTSDPMDASLDAAVMKGDRGAARQWANNYYNTQANPNQKQPAQNRQYGGFTESELAEMISEAIAKNMRKK